MEKVFAFWKYLILISIFFLSCNSPSSKISRLEKIKKEISDNNNDGSDAISRGDNSGIQRTVEKAGELNKEEESLKEEIKQMKNKLSTDEIERAKKVGVDF